MIYDLVKNAKTYKGISRNLDVALEYIERTDMSRLAMGRHPVKGDDVVAVVSSYETKDPGTTKYESHKKFIDVQLVLSGRECSYCAPAEGLKVVEPFNAEKDVGTFEDATLGVTALPLTPGAFAVFFPHDAHKPSCTLEAASTVVKVVMKVAAKRA